MSEKYHLDELRIALDPSHPAHILPPGLPSGSRVLDLGCGAGQTMIAAYPKHLTVGLDIDLPILQLGRRLSNEVRFCCGRGEAMPFRDSSFDMVIARVSLAYTDIPLALTEARRVLKPGGLLWMALHTFQGSWHLARRSNWRGRVFFSYVVVNSLLFHLTQRQFSLFGKRETFQTNDGMLKILQKTGFEVTKVGHNQHFLIEARSSKEWQARAVGAS